MKLCTDVGAKSSSLCQSIPGIQLLAVPPPRPFCPFPFPTPWQVPLALSKSPRRSKSWSKPEKIWNVWVGIMRPFLYELFGSGLCSFHYEMFVE